MYNTMINVHSGPRMLNQTLEMHSLPGKKNGLFDNLSAISSGYGGDPINFTRLNASKASSGISSDSSVAAVSTLTTICWAIRISLRADLFQSDLRMRR